MTLKLNGSSSGYTAINAPAAAGSNTLVLPANNGTAGQVLSTDGNGTLTWVDKDSAGRYFYGFKNNSSNQSVSDSTHTKVTYDSVTQSHSAFSLADNKWTATANDAGIWFVQLQVSYYSASNDGDDIMTQIYKNGSRYSGGYTWIWRGTNDVGHLTGQVQGIISIASGDYIEGYGRMNSSGTDTIFGGDSSGGSKQTSLLGFKL